MTPLAKNLLKASFAGTYAETMLTALYAGMTARLGGDLMDAGIAYGLLSLVEGFAVILIGRTQWFNDNTHKMVFWGFTIAGVCDLLYLFVQNRWQFFAVQILLGLSVGIMNPAWDALYSDDGDEPSGKKWSFWTGGVSFVVGCSAITGALVVYFIGFRTLFVVMAVCDLLAVYYSFKVMREPDTENDPK